MGELSSVEVAIPLSVPAPALPCACGHHETLLPLHPLLSPPCCLRMPSNCGTAHCGRQIDCIPLIQTAPPVVVPYPRPSMRLRMASNCAPSASHAASPPSRRASREYLCESKVWTTVEYCGIGMGCGMKAAGRVYIWRGRPTSRMTRVDTVISSI